MTDIAGLLDRVRAATGPGRDIDWDLDEAMTGEVPDFHGCLRYTASVDAALALMERKLPGTLISLTQMLSGWQASIIEPDPEALGMVMNDHFADGTTAPLAILAALLTALSSGDAS